MHEEEGQCFILHHIIIIHWELWSVFRNDKLFLAHYIKNSFFIKLTLLIFQKPCQCLYWHISNNKTDLSAKINTVSTITWIVRLRDLSTFCYRKNVRNLMRVFSKPFFSTLKYLVNPFEALYRIQIENSFWYGNVVHYQAMNNSLLKAPSIH